MKKLIVIKIGTNVITKNNGLLNVRVINNVVRQIASLVGRKYKIILVSSGAVGAGRSIIPSSDTFGKVETRQILASVGQIKLINTYSQYFTRYGYVCAQVLICREDFRDKKHYLNMKGCFDALLKNNLIPIVNENDVVAVEELMFTDNDELSGYIGAMMGAKELLILSNIPGVKDDKGQVIRKVRNKSNINKYIQPGKSAFGRGGMFTKCSISKRLSSLGIKVKIVCGSEPNIIVDAVNNKPVGTTFVPHRNEKAIKKWRTKFIL